MTKTPPAPESIPQELRERFSQATWDARYAESGQLWSGRPNQRLVEEVTGLTPGAAVDLGCGEGGDAIWLAGQGWRVLAVDVSEVALARAAVHAAAAGAGIAELITWQQADAFGWLPLPDSADLVSAQFLHLPRAVRAVLHQGLAAAVRPGGHLVIGGHHRADAGFRPPQLAELLFDPEELAAELDLTGWQVRASAPTREQQLDDGGVRVLTDAVLHAIRPA